MSLLPSECDSIPIVDPNAVPANLVALQRLEPIPRRNREVAKSGGNIERLQFPLDASPQIAWDSPGCTSVPFTKQVGGRLIAERLDHVRFYMLHV